MARHEVWFTVPERALGNSDVEFEVRRDGKAFGVLKISSGAIVWEPANAKKYQYKIKWEKFDEIVQLEGGRISR
jgi:hypothetical protein